MGFLCFPEVDDIRNGVRELTVDVVIAIQHIANTIHIGPECVLHVLPLVPAGEVAGWILVQVIQKRVVLNQQRHRVRSATLQLLNQFDATVDTRVLADQSARVHVGGTWVAFPGSEFDLVFDHHESIGVTQNKGGLVQSLVAVVFADIMDDGAFR
ncbi:MAG: hypothetical protein CL678_15840 [Bdellovibrionaceae bacterium]|nr:hypothetical protein [Pseudobdellovibrionaceae bacterium]